MKRVTLTGMAIFVGLITAGAWPQSTAPPPPSAADKFPLPGGMESEVQAPQTQAAVGSLAIQAVQGTPDAEPIGPATVTVQLYHRGILYDTIDTQLDEHGVVVIDDLPVRMSVQPVVQVRYADMTYQKIGTVMDAAHPHQTVQVTCYEPTERPPDWKITMRHVMVDRTSDGLQVKEVIVIENPADRTWLGVPSVNEKRVTTSFVLPGGAKDVRLGKGFHDWCCTTFADGTLVNHLPLMPKTTELNFSYVVPIVNGSAEIAITAPAVVEDLMLIVPADMTAASTEGLELRGTEQIGEQSVRYYRAANQQNGASAIISLTGLGGPTAVTTGASAGPAKIVAAIGGGVLVLITVVILFAKSSRPMVGAAS